MTTSSLTLEFGMRRPSPLFKSWRKLFKRTNGAVMVMGLFMACFLAGCLWYVVGIGDAIIFRDRMQETADAVSFSAAVVHARGMNFIVAINLVMIALTALYLLLAIVTDITEFIQIVAGHPYKWWGAEVCWFDIHQDCTFSYPFFCWPTVPCKCMDIAVKAMLAVPYLDVVAAFIQDITGGDVCNLSELNDNVEKLVADNAFPKYYDFIGKTLPILEKVEHVAAIATPWVAEVVALDTGSRFDDAQGRKGHVGMMLSLSLIPAATIAGKISGLGSNPYANDKFRFSAVNVIGLPVESLRMGALCVKTGQFAIEALASFPIISTIVNMIPGMDWLVNFVAKAIGNALQGRYCNWEGDKQPNPQYSDWDSSDAGPRDLWGKEGPKTVYGSAENGNDFMQVWGFVVNTAMIDQSNHIVALGQKPRDTTALRAANESPMFVAQAEFFHDCPEVWKNAMCNGSEFGGDEGYAMYRPHWRARLRRVHKPDLLKDLVSVGISSVLSPGNGDVVGGAIKNSAPFKKFSSWAGGAISGIVKAGVDAAISKAGDAVNTGITKTVTTVSADGIINTVIH